MSVVTDSPFSQVCRWLGAAGPVVATPDDMKVTDIPVGPGGFHNPIMDDEDAHRADLMDVMRFRDLCAYFKRSPNATRRIVRELGIRPTKWTEDSLRKTYLRRDVYAAVMGAGRAVDATPAAPTRAAKRRAAR